MKIINRKGFSGQVMILASSALALVVAGLVMGYGAKVSSDVSADLTGSAQAAADNATEGISRLAKQTPLVGTVLAAVVVITILLAGFGGFLTGRRR